MNDNTQATLEQWILQCFQNEEADQSHYPLFKEVFLRELNETSMAYEIATLTGIDRLLDADNPERGTCRESVEQNVHDLFQCYMSQILEGHGTAYAVAYLDASTQGCDSESTSGKAYLTMSKGSKPSPDDPAYVDAYNSCIWQGKTKEFAKRCAEYLFDNDLSFPRAIKATAAYESDFKLMRDRGHSDLRARMYAECMLNGPSTDFANYYAECVEEQIQQGRDSRKAEIFAKIHASILFDYGKPDENSLEYEKYRLFLQSKAEAEYRSLSYSEKRDREDFKIVFEQLAQRIPRKENQEKPVWFDDIETQTRQEMTQITIRRELYRRAQDD